MLVFSALSPIGARQPSGGETLFVRGGETVIDDFNQLGGGTTAKIFDGTTSQALDGGNGLPYKSGGTSAYVGITFGSGTKINRVLCFGSNDDGYIFNNNVSTTLTLYGKTGSAPSSATDGTSLGSTSFTDGDDESAGREITSSDTSTAWDHVWIHIDPGASYSITAAELQIYTL